MENDADTLDTLHPRSRSQHARSTKPDWNAYISLVLSPAFSIISTHTISYIMSHTSMSTYFPLQILLALTDAYLMQAPTKRTPSTSLGAWRPPSTMKESLGRPRSLLPTASRRWARMSQRGLRNSRVSSSSPTRNEARLSDDGHFVRFPMLIDSRPLGYKAVLKSKHSYFLWGTCLAQLWWTPDPHVSEEAKQHAQQVLEESGVSSWSRKIFQRSVSNVIANQNEVYLM